MKRIAVVSPLICLILGVLLPPRAAAQIDVRIKSEQEQFLPAEAIAVSVRIGNFTGGPLPLGTHPHWIAFTVERADGGVVNKLSEPAELGEFVLQQATAGTVHFDLAPQFALEQAGTYRITATVTPIAGRETFASPPLKVEIVNGVRLNEDRMFGYTGLDGTVVARKYILQQVNFLKNLRLYLRVTDGAENQTLKVLQLGQLVSFNHPQWVMDRKSHLHVLHQTGPDDLRYHEVDPEGTLVTRQIWRISGRRPELRVNESGEIAVVGGTRRPDRSDIPVPPKPQPIAAVKADQTEVVEPSLKTNAPASSSENAPAPKKKNAPASPKGR